VEKMQADILVIGSRGLGTFKRAFLGSTSDYCVHHCQCPVIVVKQQQQEQKETMKLPSASKE
jgi:nucleotide-binding universal stress UspA family protein